MNLRLSQIVFSILLFSFVIAEDLRNLPEFAYIAVFSILPFIYGALRDDRALILFPIILAFAYVPVCFLYPFDVQSILIISLIWPMFFAVFSTLSYPDSRELEKRAVMVWLLSSGIAVFSILGALSITAPVKNAFILGILGVMAGIAMTYMTVGKGFISRR